MQSEYDNHRESIKADFDIEAKIATAGYAVFNFGFMGIFLAVIFTGGF